MTQEGQIVLTVVTIASLIFNTGLGFRGSYKAKTNKETIEFGILGVGSMIGLIFILNVI